ncbi:Programmed cell death protein 2 [Paragonimus heterotremus]|uniref:Programmed cell death protein 2 n=1 Tax=Paragonimus heterotremus TaxID=100268 RepID=A0A8J4WJF5_9TREM|nr:Programmed cell death protein 2 [Paragonimus heterotremus]
MALVGYVSKPDPKFTPTAYDSFVGGCLISLSNIPLPPDHLLICRTCGHHMCFIAQIYCPLTNSGYHRSVYLFVCLRRRCQLEGFNWTALRSQKAEIGALPTGSRLESDWSLGGDELEEEDENNCTAEYGEETVWDKKPHKHRQAACDVNVLVCENAVEASVSLPGPFVCSFVDVYEDTDTSDDFGKPEMIDDSIGTASTTGQSAFTLLSQAAEIEQAFMDEDDNTMEHAFSGTLVAHLSTRGEFGCEDVRYFWSGVPIFNGPPPVQLQQHLTCPRCKSSRTFELQIFSAINNSLKLKLPDPQHNALLSLHDLCEDDLDPDWLLKITTVLIFSCINSCWTDSDDWVRECVVVQTDHDRTCCVDGESTAVFSE